MQTLRRHRWKIVAVIALAVAIALTCPQYFGFLSPSGRALLWVGRDGVGVHHDGGPVWLRPRAKCVDSVQSLLPPYEELGVRMDCAAGDIASLPQDYEIYIYGKESSVDPVAFAFTERAFDPRQQLPGETVIEGQPVQGYVGFSSGAGTHSATPGTTYLSQIRLVAPADAAVVKVLDCVVVWTVATASDEIDRGSCSGFGLYRTIIFKIDFKLDKSMTEAVISKSVAIAIDRMVD